MNLAVFIVEKQDEDSHLKVGNVVCDVIYDILEHFQIYYIFNSMSFNIETYCYKSLTFLYLFLYFFLYCCSISDDWSCSFIH